MMEFKSIFSALQHNLDVNPDRLVYSFANEQGQIDQALTWRDMNAKTDALTGFLRTRCALQPGTRVLLVYPPSIDFILAFVACLRAGLIPVPVYPPNPMQADNGMDAFNRIATNCDAQLVLTNRQYSRARKMGAIQDLVTFKPTKWAVSLDWVTTDDINAGDYAPVHGPTAKPDDVALIQYTSGSTSAPKGVVITHGNLSHQLEYTRIAMKTDADSRAVFWVPQYHDLGLIGGILNALGGNAHLILFSPLAFIKRPALWFDIMHKMRATHTAAPNFAYELALRKTTPEQRAKWDLSSLQMVMSAAEPVRAHTMRRFVEAFAVSGLKAEAYLPAYGLAEHTVAVSFNGGIITHVDKNKLESQRLVVTSDTATENTLELVSSGTWQEDVKLRIVNPETLAVCADNAVGEVWVDSPSKAAGYWKMEQENARSFTASLAVDDGVRYLRTGDLGFLHDGQLYICGRLKDMLILAGKNIYPQDIEDSIQHADDAIKPGGMAAFAVDVKNGALTEEKLVLLVEVRDPKYKKAHLQQLAQKLQRAVLENHQTPCHAIVLTPVGTVLKTTSGKVRRQACRQLWMEGTLQKKALYVLQTAHGVTTSSSKELASSAAKAKQSGNKNKAGKQQTMTPREAMMQKIAAQMLNMPSPDAIDIHQPLTQQGMGSLIAVEFCQEYETAALEELSITQFFNYPTISTLCKVLETSGESNESLDMLFQDNPSKTVKELHGLRHYLLNNRFGKTGFRIGDWGVRPATLEDVPEIHRLDQQEYGWLGEDATDDADFIHHQVKTLNSSTTPWLWLLEKKSTLHSTMDIVGWYIMQPTHKAPGEITSWADATDHGRLTGTFDPAGKNLYIVAGGITREHTKQAHRLMVLNALSLMHKHNMNHVFACLAMPGFSEARASEGVEADEYIRLEHANGMPRDAFLAFFKELWAGEHHPLRLLVNGYPPDQRSGGHGVCACVNVTNHRKSIEMVFDKLVQQRVALFGDIDQSFEAEEKSVA